MEVKFLKFGDRLRTLNVPDGIVIADVLRLAGEDPENLNGLQVRVSGEPSDVKLDRPVHPNEAVMLVPKVMGG